MSLFGEASNRLMRTNWKSIDELAKELYALFTSNIPVRIEGGLEIVKQTGRPPLKIIDRLQPSSTDGLLALESNDQSKELTYDDLGLLSGSESDGSDLSNLISQRQVQGQIIGVIVSGTGSNYQVDLYKQGYPGPSSRVSAIQLQIDPADSVPAGTFTMVSQVGTQYYFQASVWL